MERKKNQSQGAKSCECDGWVTSWTSLVARKSRFTAAVSALALSWWSSRTQTPVRRRRSHHAGKTLGKQWLTYQSSVTVFMSSSGMVATWPNLQRNTLPFVWKHFCFLWISQVGSHLGIPTLPTVALSRGCIGIPKFCLLLWCPKREETILHQIFLACECTSPPYPAFALHSAYGARNGHNISLRQGSREKRAWDFPDEIFMISCISAYVIFGSFLIRTSTLETFSGVMVVAIRTQRSSSSNVLSPDMKCLNHLKIVPLDRDDLQNSVLKFDSTLEKIFPGRSHNTS